MTEYSRPNVQPKTRILDLDAIPPGKYEMNYRFPLPRSRWAVLRFLITFAILSFSSLPALFTVRRCGIILLLPGTPMLAFLIGAISAVRFVASQLQIPDRRDRMPRRELASRAYSKLFFPLGLWLALLFVYEVTTPAWALYILLPIAVLAVLHFSDSLATHFVYWATANPRNDLHTLRRWRTRAVKILSRTPSRVLDMNYGRPLWGKLRRCRWPHSSPSQYNRKPLVFNGSPIGSSMIGPC